MDKIKWIIFSVVVVVFLAALIIFSGSTRLDVSKIDTYSVQSARINNGNIADHVFGKVDSKVTVIEYGDYQCPGCSAINPNINSLMKEYQNQIQFIFRNFPLTTAHANAKAAAGAVEAAGLQGKYWEMHNKVYAAQSDWYTLTGDERTNFFVAFAQDLQLDSTKFIADMASSEVNAKISYDQALGTKSGVDATPYFYLNGAPMDKNAVNSAIRGDMKAFKDLVNAELTKNGIALPQSTN